MCPPDSWCSLTMRHICDYYFFLIMKGAPWMNAVKEYSDLVTQFYLFDDVFHN